MRIEPIYKPIAIDGHMIPQRMYAATFRGKQAEGRTRIEALKLFHATYNIEKLNTVERIRKQREIWKK